MSIASREAFETNHEVVGVVALETIVSRVRPVLTGMDRTVYPGSNNWKRGIMRGDEMVYITIAGNNVWGGETHSGGCVSSYEKIGYHSGSVDFIAGAIASDCPVYAYCEDGWRRVES
jgi:hypothetical protein